MELSQINVLAVLAAALSSFLIGGIWYSNLLFGAAWAREIGRDEDANGGNMARIFGLSFVASLVIALNLAMFLGAGVTLATGTLYGFLAGFGWVAMAFAINDLFEQRSLELYLINAGYHTVAFTVMGAILGAWHAQ